MLEVISPTNLSATLDPKVCWLSLGRALGLTFDMHGRYELENLLLGIDRPQQRVRLYSTLLNARLLLNANLLKCNYSPFSCVPCERVFALLLESFNDDQMIHRILRLLEFIPL